MVEKSNSKEKNTKSDIIKNLVWRFAERCGAKLVTFFVSIILARLLSPEDYGTIALINVFITILSIFVDSGLGNALIQKKNADTLDFSTVFYTNIVFCVILYSLLYFCAPIIASFYENPELTLLVRVLGITILISGVKNVQQAYVSRNMLFKKFFFATLGGTIISAGLGIFGAVRGYGVWALVIQQVSNVLIGTIVLWRVVKWRPTKEFSIDRFRNLFQYGWKLLVSSLLDTGYNNLRQLIIGKLYSTSDLAFYEKGRQFPNLIVTNVNASIDSVLLPSMSNFQDDKIKIKNMTRRAIKISVYVMAPLMMGLFATATSVVQILLTDKWIGCVPFLRIFCVVYMFQPIHTANLNAIKAMGRSDLFLKLEVIKKIIGIALLLLTLPHGVMAMAYSLLISNVLSQIVNTWPNWKLLNYNYFEQLKDIMPSIILAVVMSIFVWTIELLNLSTIITLVIQVALGAVIYIVGSKIFKIDSFVYLWNIIKPILNKKEKTG